MAGHPALHLEPISDVLVQEAERLGLERRLRGADALYAATAARLGCPFLSWDRELVARGGAQLPSDWLAGRSASMGRSCSTPPGCFPQK